MKREKLKVMCDIAILMIMKRSKLKVICEIMSLGRTKRAKLNKIEKHASQMRNNMCRVVFLQY